LPGPVQSSPFETFQRLEPREPSSRILAKVALFDPKLAVYWREPWMAVARRMALCVEVSKSQAA
jgi:hypothetical protein